MKKNKPIKKQKVEMTEDLTVSLIEIMRFLPFFIERLQKLAEVVYIESDYATKLKDSFNNMVFNAKLLRKYSCEFIESQEGHFGEQSIDTYLADCTTFDDLMKECSNLSEENLKILLNYIRSEKSYASENQGVTEA